MSFPRYPEYQDSGVEWLGEVPARHSAPSVGHGQEFDFNSFIDET